MNSYTFVKAFSQGWVKITVQADNYDDALVALAFQVGSSAAAKQYAFVDAR